MLNFDLNKKAIFFVILLLLVDELADASFFGKPYSHSASGFSQVHE